MAPSRIITRSARMAPMEMASVSQTNAKISSGDQIITRVSNAKAPIAVKAAAAIYCTAVPALRSPAVPKRFCQTVPVLIARTAKKAANRLCGSTPLPAENFGQTTMATPRKPTRRPSHCRPLARSPRRSAAISVVSMGCKPATSPDMPAGNP